MREPWRLFWASLFLFLVVDADCKVDARTGVPVQDGAGALETLLEALETLLEAGIDNKSLKEMMIIMFQYARRQPRATGTAIATATATTPRVKAVLVEKYSIFKLNARSIISEVSIMMNSVILPVHSYRLFGPNGVIWTSKITLHKRKFGRPSIRTVQNYG